MIDSLRHFPEVWLCDFEFRAPDGERPEPVCMVAQGVAHGPHDSRMGGSAGQHEPAALLGWGRFSFRGLLCISRVGLLPGVGLADAGPRAGPVLRVPQRDQRRGHGGRQRAVGRVGPLRVAGNRRGRESRYAGVGPTPRAAHRSRTGRPVGLLRNRRGCTRQAVAGHAAQDRLAPRSSQGPLHGRGCVDGMERGSNRRGPPRRATAELGRPERPAGPADRRGLWGVRSGRPGNQPRLDLRGYAVRPG